MLFRSSSCAIVSTHYLFGVFKYQFHRSHPAGFRDHCSEALADGSRPCSRCLWEISSMMKKKVNMNIKETRKSGLTAATTTHDELRLINKSANKKIKSRNSSSNVISWSVWKWLKLDTDIWQMTNLAQLILYFFQCENHKINETRKLQIDLVQKKYMCSHTFSTLRLTELCDVEPSRVSLY